MGFYLQPSVGGRVFSYDYWQRMCDIDGVIGINVHHITAIRHWMLLELLPYQIGLMASHYTLVMMIILYWI